MNPLLLGYLLVFLGGGIGAALRHAVNRSALATPEFPYHTLTVNALGCLAMGLLAGWFTFRTGEHPSQHLRLFLTTGILGGFTTFSAFSLDTALLWERGQTGAAFLYVAGNVVLSLIGVFFGLTLMRTLAS